VGWSLVSGCMMLWYSILLLCSLFCLTSTVREKERECNPNAVFKVSCTVNGYEQCEGKRKVFGEGLGECVTWLWSVVRIGCLGMVKEQVMMCFNFNPFYCFWFLALFPGLNSL